MSFQTLALTMEAASAEGRPVAPLLVDQCPKLTANICEDLTNDALLKLWGGSVNWDELANAPIVAPEIITAILGLAADGRELSTADAVHAGLMHTYCYLFSRLETQFGLKGDRWTKGEIAQVLALPPDVLSPTPSQGTLLGNVTYLLGRFAFRGDSRQLAVLRHLRSRIPKTILGVPFRRTRWTRIVETAKLGRGHNITFHTDLVPPVEPATNSKCLLIYSIAQRHPAQRQHPPVLITAFPVGSSTVEDMLNPHLFGGRDQIRARYNAWVPELAGGKMIAGSREAWQFSGAGKTRMI